MGRISTRIRISPALDNRQAVFVNCDKCDNAESELMGKIRISKRAKYNSRPLCAAALCALLMPLASNAFGQGQPRDPDNSESRETAAFFAAPFNALLRLYRGALRRARPAICQMHPSDSAYAVESIKRHGPAKGILLASDRVQRCGNDTHHYESVIVNGQPLYSDPVP